MSHITWEQHAGDARVHQGRVGKVVLFMIKPSMVGGQCHLLVRTIPSVAAPDRARDWTRVEQNISLERAKELAGDVWEMMLNRLGLTPQ